MMGAETWGIICGAVACMIVGAAMGWKSRSRSIHRWKAAYAGWCSRASEADQAITEQAEKINNLNRTEASLRADLKESQATVAGYASTLDTQQERIERLRSFNSSLERSAISRSSLLDEQKGLVEKLQSDLAELDAAAKLDSEKIESQAESIRSHGEVIEAKDDEIEELSAIHESACDRHAKLVGVLNDRIDELTAATKKSAKKVAAKKKTTVKK